MNCVQLIGAICIVLFGYTNAECTVPHGDAINWEKMSGQWYEVLNGNLTYDEKMSCLSSYVTADKKDGGNSFSLTGTGVSGNKEIIHRTLKFVDEGNGYYQVSYGKDISSESLEAIAEGNLVHDIGKDSGATKINLDQSSFFTDHKTYAMQLMCDNSGNKNIWCFTRTKRLSVEQLLAFTNRLANIGNGWSEVQLRLIHCDSY